MSRLKNWRTNSLTLDENFILTVSLNQNICRWWQWDLLQVLLSPQVCSCWLPRSRSRRLGRPWDLQRTQTQLPSFLNSMTADLSDHCRAKILAPKKKNFMAGKNLLFVRISNKAWKNLGNAYFFLKFINSKQTTSLYIAF